MSSLSIARYFPWRRMRVTGQSVSDESRMALVKLSPDRRFRPLCHDCGQPGGFHSWTRKFVRDRSFGDYSMLLQIEYRKLRCRQCRRVRVERLDFVDTSQRVTMRLGTYGCAYGIGTGRAACSLRRRHVTGGLGGAAYLCIRHSRSGSGRREVVAPSSVLCAVSVAPGR